VGIGVPSIKLPELPDVAPPLPVFIVKFEPFPVTVVAFAEVIGPLYVSPFTDAESYGAIRILVADSTSAV
jgi:hypothetical protein